MTEKQIAPKRSENNEVICGNGCKEVLAVPVTADGERGLRPKKGFALIFDGSWGLIHLLKNADFRKQAIRCRQAGQINLAAQRALRRETKGAAEKAGSVALPGGGNRRGNFSLETGGEIRLRCPSCDALNVVCIEEWFTEKERETGPFPAPKEGAMII